MDDADPSLLDPAVLRQLLRQLARTDVEELEIVRGDSRIYVRREPGASPGSGAASATIASQTATQMQPGVPVPAPLAGVFYSRPSPEEPPYVRVGDIVDIGTVVGLIETMKMYNEVSSEIAGEVLTVEVQNGVLVDSGQALLYVRIVDEETL